MSYRSWWTYWISVVLWAAVALGVALTRVHLGRSDPLWVTGLSVPPVIAGIDLIVFRSSHEQICARESRERAWLRALVGNGYSARTFLLTGVVLVLGGVVLGAALLLRT